MIRKLQLFSLALFTSATLSSQITANQPVCGTQAPSQQWQEWFNKEVEKYTANLASGKTQMVNYTIPVIVHIVHFGEAVGTFPNIDSNQVKSQLDVLNNDFAGAGLNVGTVPFAFANLVANTGIKFCRAKNNPQGGALIEPGIHRVDADGSLWPNPATYTGSIQYYINTFVKPSTAWDPVRYLNIWISDRPTGETLNGFATYPAGTSLTGIPSGSLGGINSDGIWVWTKAFGTLGTIQAPFDEGRTATHELGHWLGLRHTWGDGNCMTDYCNDTPWAKLPNTGCPPVPSHIDRCGAGQSSYGEMTMNFMDATEDACKYMFTHDQNIRIQTAMSQCAYRNTLGTHNLCAPTNTVAASASASFSLNSTPCIGSPFTPFNTSSGNPPPTYVWSSSPPASFNPAPSVANPAISLSTNGNYTLTLVATNSLVSSTFTMAINNVTTCPFISTCLDSLKGIKVIDTLRSYVAPNNTLVVGCQTGFAGYLTGSNCYKDKEFAQFFSPSSYTSVPSPQVNSMIVLFNEDGTVNGGTNPAVQITCRIYGGNVSSGPLSQIGFKADSLVKIINSPKTNVVGFVGIPNYVTPSNIIPYRYDFVQPVVINSASGFFGAIETPWFSAGDSIRIYSSQKAVSSVDSNAWFLQYGGSWKTFRYFRQSKIQLGIIPIITCSPIVGLKESTSAFHSNINLMPNPSNGNFNMVFTLNKPEDVIIRIYNTLGKEISRTNLRGVKNEVFTIDLSTEPDGIYMAEISNQSEKVVKKLIINH